MHDTRDLKNPRNSSSWRAWRREAFQRSGYFVILIPGVCPLLALVFVIACTLFKPALRDAEIGFGLYLATALGLMVLAVLRLNAWKRANPWTPPS
ncbi:MAG: hypothetical protein ACYC8V_14800 [Caulobacteraceae bacterium]